ncbi:MAG: FAD-dependent oxidoreductase [Acidimicrobiales bacterium]
MSDFPCAFTPVHLRHRRLPNRIAFGPHPTNLAGDDGLPGDALAAYLRERAFGGAGLIVVEPRPVHLSALVAGRGLAPVGAVGAEADVAAFRRLTDAAHEAGDATVIQQLWHPGPHGDEGGDGTPTWSPSGASTPYGHGSHTMSERELDDLVAAYAEGARRAQQAGFDGVEIAAGAHTLLSELWTPGTNRRDDRWGGANEARMRFSRLVLERIRALCGDELVIGLALSVDPDNPRAPSGGDQARPLGVAELTEIAGWHDDRELVDYVACGTGSLRQRGLAHPTTLHAELVGEPLAAAVAAAVTTARVLCAGHVRTMANAEAVLAAGHADLVAITRGQIADPHLVGKAAVGQANRIRPCISCNDGCVVGPGAGPGVGTGPDGGATATATALRCLVNPEAGREHRWGAGVDIYAAAAPRRVVVIGGGPAGLEAARVAAERGHQVRLYEASDHLGGQWRLAGLQPTRSPIADHLAWYEAELHRLGVEIHRGATFSPSARMWEQVIVVATGAAPARAGRQRALPGVQRLPGVGSSPGAGAGAGAGAASDRSGAAGVRVADIADVARGAVIPAGDVLVVDDTGDWRGIGTALLLQQLRCRVGLVTVDAAVAARLTPAAGGAEARRRFARSGGVAFVHTVVTAWDGTAGRATLRHVLTDRVDEVGADWLVLAETPTAAPAGPSASVAEQVAEACPHAAIHVVGDALAPRHAAAAIAEAHALALTL